MQSGMKYVVNMTTQVYIVPSCLPLQCSLEYNESKNNNDSNKSKLMSFITIHIQHNYIISVYRCILCILLKYA